MENAVNLSYLRIKCKREYDYVITLFITNEISLLLTWALLKTRVTPNQVSIVSILCAAASGIFYMSGYFFLGSCFLFTCHVLDCTDGNLARAKQMFSPFGRWLDFLSDRLSEIFIFIGFSFFYLKKDATVIWIILPLLDCILLLLYYYLVDVAMALGISKKKQHITTMKFKDVFVKWGIFEPVLYGFILLVPLGLLNLHIIIVLFITLAALSFQVVKQYSWLHRPI